MTCVEPGATATELPQSIADPAFMEAAPPFEGTPMPPEPIAEAIAHAIAAPDYATVTEVMVMPTDQFST